MKIELKARDYGFNSCAQRPLITGDTNAYFIKINDAAKGERIKVTAYRADGTTVIGVGGTSDNGTIEYVLDSEMYSVEGELCLSVAVMTSVSCVTVRKLECIVQRGV